MVVVETLEKLEMSIAACFGIRKLLFSRHLDLNNFFEEIYRYKLYCIELPLLGVLHIEQKVRKS